MGFDTVDVERGLDPGARKGVDNRLTGMRQHVGIVLALGDLRVEFHRRCMMAPTENARDLFKLEAVTAGMLRGELLGSNKEHRAAVGYLRAVTDADSSR